MSAVVHDITITPSVMIVVIMICSLATSSGTRGILQLGNTLLRPYQTVLIFIRFHLDPAQFLFCQMDAFFGIVFGLLDAMR